MRWAGDVARMGETRNVCNILVGKPERKTPSEDLGVDGRTVVECMNKVERC
jgi:hypothetical protein